MLSFEFYGSRKELKPHLDAIVGLIKEHNRSLPKGERLPERFIVRGKGRNLSIIPKHDARIYEHVTEAKLKAMVRVQRALDFVPVHLSHEIVRQVRSGVKEFNLGVEAGPATWQVLSTSEHGGVVKADMKKMAHKLFMLMPDPEDAEELMSVHGNCNLFYAPVPAAFSLVSEGPKLAEIYDLKNFYKFYSLSGERVLSKKTARKYSNARTRLISNIFSHYSPNLPVVIAKKYVSEYPDLEKDLKSVAKKQGLSSRWIEEDSRLGVDYPALIFEKPAKKN